MPASEDELEPYWMDVVEEQDQPTSYCVVGASGQTVLASKDSATAMHYIELLNRAHRAGYKKGFRAGKNA